MVRYQATDTRRWARLVSQRRNKPIKQQANSQQLPASARRHRHAAPLGPPPRCLCLLPRRAPTSREEMDCCRHVNPFRACAGLRGLGYLMVALVAAIVALSYYAVVVYAWGPMLLAGGAAAAGAAAVIAAFHILVSAPLPFLLRSMFSSTTA